MLHSVVQSTILTSLSEQSAHHLLLNLCSQLSEKILEGFVFRLQLGTPLSIQKGLVQSTKFQESLRSSEPGFHITWIVI